MDYNFSRFPDYSIERHPVISHLTAIAAGYGGHLSVHEHIAVNNEHNIHSWCMDGQISHLYLFHFTRHGCDLCVWDSQCVSKPISYEVKS